MRKLLLVITLASGLHLAHAQKSVYTELPGRLFSQGKEMFLNNNYVGCINTLQEFKNQSKDIKLMEEADYMIVSSLFYQGKAGDGTILKDFLDDYPESYHRNQISFFSGSIHFQQKDWNKALHRFKQVEINYLSVSEQEDYSYRMA